MPSVTRSAILPGRVLNTPKPGDENPRVKELNDQIVPFQRAVSPKQLALIGLLNEYNRLQVEWLKNPTSESNERMKEILADMRSIHEDIQVPIDNICLLKDEIHHLERELFPDS